MFLVWPTRQKRPLKISYDSPFKLGALSCTRQAQSPQPGPGWSSTGCLEEWNWFPLNDQSQVLFLGQLGLGRKKHHNFNLFFIISTFNPLTDIIFFSQIACVLKLTVNVFRYFLHMCVQSLNRFMYLTPLAEVIFAFLKGALKLLVSQASRKSD